MVRGASEQWRVAILGPPGPPVQKCTYRPAKPKLVRIQLHSPPSSSKSFRSTGRCMYVRNGRGVIARTTRHPAVFLGWGTTEEAERKEEGGHSLHSRSERAPPPPNVSGEPGMLTPRQDLESVPETRKPSKPTTNCRTRPIRTGLWTSKDCASLSATPTTRTEPPFRTPPCKSWPSDQG